MRTLGVGSRCSVLVVAVAMLGGASACSTESSAVAAEHMAADHLAAEHVAAEGASASSAARARAPEQVVQNMRAPGAATAEPRGGALESGARASAAGSMSRANTGTLAPRSNGAETITSKHLEAELNRLEAELAN
ncbi:MAG TPA: hypothetical protein VMG12_21670 [Polyangiaceae bacterium]|nr:hypothetical protein [Polyangiaceae bacterium]